MERFQEFSTKTPKELFALLKTSPEGLTAEQAQQHLKEQGPNTFEAKGLKWWHIAFRQFRSAFVYLLLAASLVALFLGEYLNAALIFFFLFINAALGFFQEFKAEHSLRFLKQLTQRKTRVRRDGKVMLVNVEKVVSGDIVQLRAGDMLPADGYFLKAENVSIDESALTGESSSSEKSAGAQERTPADLFGARNIGFSRTMLASGEGELLVFATGKETTVGNITKEMEETRNVSGFELGISRFSTFVLRLVLITVPLVFVANALIGKEHLDIGALLLFSIALTVSVIPEALPLVTTLSLTRGAVQLARKHVVPRRLSAIEDLGSIEILCTDKTGTITENKLKGAEFYGDAQEVAFWGLASSVQFLDAKEHSVNVFDQALFEVLSAEAKERILKARRLDESPFDPLRRRESVLLELESKRSLVIRGAPEAVLEKDGKDREQRLAWAQTQGQKGRRVLAVAKKELSQGSPDSFSPEDEAGAIIVGLVSFADPLKPSAHKALQDAERLGVRVKILTGDSKEVAGWVAYEAGLIENPKEVLTGEEFAQLSDEQKMNAVEKYDVFARTLPLQKYDIIEMLQKKFLVGFLGEGFNDAPALKLAHVGLAVEGASDIAQDASDIVLLNKSLEVIVEGIKEGRKIFANTLKYIKATLTSNFGNFYALAFASLVIDFLPMLPIQILLLNLLSDFPMISIATDAVDQQELKRPKGYNIREIGLVALVLGLVSTVFDFTFFGFFVRHGEETLQSMWFIGSVLTELVLLYSIRTSGFFLKAKAPSKTIFIFTGVVGLIAIILPFSALGQQLFSFEPPKTSFLVAALVIVGLYFAVTEIVKLWVYSFINNRERSKL